MVESELVNLHCEWDITKEGSLLINGCIEAHIVSNLVILKRGILRDIRVIFGKHIKAGGSLVVFHTLLIQVLREPHLHAVRLGNAFIFKVKVELIRFLLAVNQPKTVFHLYFNVIVKLILLKFEVRGKHLILVSVLSHHDSISTHFGRASPVGWLILRLITDAGH